jgi:hypothetical protein
MLATDWATWFETALTGLLTMRFECEGDVHEPKNLLEVDWSKIPAPTDDGAAP